MPPALPTLTTPEIVPVACRRTRLRFERLTEALHGEEPVFAPAMPGSIEAHLVGNSPFARHHGRVAGFLAMRGSHVVGRIAAIENRSHNRHHSDRAGFFGFFACEDSAATAQALFARARAWLRAAGLESIRGPYNPSINDDCGLLTEGFDALQVMGLPWNPAYYPALVEACGLAPACTLFGFHLPLAEREINPRVEKIAARMAERSRLRVRPVDMSRLEADLEIIRRVYNDTLERNWGFVPISDGDLRGAAAEFRAIAIPSMIMIAEQNGEPAGVAVTLPNFDEYLLKIKKSPRWLRWLHLLWLVKTRAKTQAGRFIIYGILPKFRDRGLHGWLLGEQFREARKIWPWAQLGWVEESNTETLESCRLMGAHQNKKWVIYEGAL